MTITGKSKSVRNPSGSQIRNMWAVVAMPDATLVVHVISVVVEVAASDMVGTCMVAI